MAGDKIMSVVHGQDFSKTMSKQERAQERYDRIVGKKDSGKGFNPEKLERREQKLNQVNARRGRQDAFDGSLDSYDYGSFGGEKAGTKDIERLAVAGFSANEIADSLEKRGIESTGRANALLAKYMQEVKEGLEDLMEDIVPDLPEAPEEILAPPVIEEPVNPGPVIQPTPVDPGPILPDRPVIVPVSPGNDTVQTGTIGGDTGDISLVDSNNYGTINSGIINETNNYGGGYGAGENNTGLAQQYVDLMQDNWEKYSGPAYGMFITDTRADKADDLNPIDTNEIYGSLNRFAGNMYDRGFMTMGGLYGDPNKFPVPTYPGGFSDIGTK